MADTPLELYDRAYDLQNREEDQRGAVSLYREIIERFPDSNEAGYAVIQLEKMNADQVIAGLARSTRRTEVLTLGILALNLVALVAVTGLLIFRTDRLAQQQEVLDYALEALGLAVAGEDSAALEMLAPLKDGDRSGAVPYVLSACIHMRREDQARARAELNAYGEANPEVVHRIEALVAAKEANPRNAKKVR